MGVNFDAKFEKFVKKKKKITMLPY